MGLRGGPNAAVLPPPRPRPPLLRPSFLLLAALITIASSASASASIAGPTLDFGDPILSVPYYGGAIKVWKEPGTPAKYSALPPGLLLPETAESRTNLFTALHQLKFAVLMWSPEVREVVKAALSEAGETGVNSEDILQLPLQRWRLLWSGARELSENFELDSTWKTMAVPENPAPVLRGVFTCRDRDLCKEAAESVKGTKGTDLAGLELELQVAGRETGLRRVEITGSTFKDGTLLKTYLNLLGKKGLSSGYLAKEHVDRVASEAASELALTINVSSPIGEHLAVGEMDRLEKHLEEVLTLGTGVSSDLLDDVAWGGLFWDPDWSHPYKVSTILNRILRKKSKDSFEMYLLSQKGLRSRRSLQSFEPKDTLQFLVMAIGNLPNPNAGLGRGQELDKLIINKTDLLYFLSENHNHVHYDGEKFTVKPFMLYRVDIDKISSNVSFGSHNLKVERDTRSVVSDVLLGENVIVHQNRVHEKLEYLSGQLQKLENETRQLEKGATESKNTMLNLQNDLEESIIHVNSSLEESRTLDLQMQRDVNKSREHLDTIKTRLDAESKARHTSSLELSREVEDKISELIINTTDPVHKALCKAIGNTENDLGHQIKLTRKCLTQIEGPFDNIDTENKTICERNEFNEVPMYQDLLFGEDVSRIRARCNADDDGRAWTVILRRDKDATKPYEDFDNKVYAEYVRGFGDPEEEFWIGLEAMRMLTNDHGQTDLKIVMTSVEGVQQWITYDNFTIGDSAEFYKLHLGNKTGGNVQDCLSYHNGQSFTAMDQDHDKRDSSNCAQEYKGGFWYKHCFNAKLTGAHGSSNKNEGICWHCGGNCGASEIQAKAEMMVSAPVNE